MRVKFSGEPQVGCCTFLEVFNSKSNFFGTCGSVTKYVLNPIAIKLSGLVLAGQRLSGVILFRYLIWRMRYGGQITIAGN
ncbi:MAG: hypothetical protein ACI8R4_001646, partial [Paracoccaceae bacterium]